MSLWLLHQERACQSAARLRRLNRTGTDRMPLTVNWMAERALADVLEAQVRAATRAATHGGWYMYMVLCRLKRREN